MARPQLLLLAQDCCVVVNPILFTAGSLASSKAVLAAFLFELDAGANPLFPPRHRRAEDAQEAVLKIIRRDPVFFGITHPRWTLRDIRSECSFLHLSSDASLSNLLRRLHISYKRGRDYVHSPDPDYNAKLEYIDRLLTSILDEEPADEKNSGDEKILLYEDEFTYYRQPSIARAFEEQGHHQALARRSHSSNTATRVMGTLNVRSGRVHYWQGAHTEVATIVNFYKRLTEEYAQAKRLYIIQDNWSIHSHPDILVALEEQESPWPRYAPSNWSTEASKEARRKWADWKLPIQLVQLPTYASWLNPIEKLWKLLKQEVLHMHRQADQLPELRQKVINFLNQYRNGSTTLLKYVGLLVPH